MTYPAGCRCAGCALLGQRSGGPVPGEGPSDASLVILGEAPGPRELDAGRPFVGPSGQFLNDMLKVNNLDRKSIRITNTLLCKQPEEFATMGEYLAKLDSGDPLAHCRSRLLAELQSADAIICMGNVALRAVAGLYDGVLKWRGSPLRVQIPKWQLGLPEFLQPPEANTPAEDGGNVCVDGQKWCFTTLHPAAVLRAGPLKVLTNTLKTDFAKFIRIWRTGKTTWDESGAHPLPSAAELLDAIARARASNKIIAVDTETTGAHVSTTHLLCVGFAFDEEAWVVPLRTIEDELWPWPDESDRDRVFEALAELLADEKCTFLFHNCLFDLPVLESNGLPVRGAYHDTMLMHHAALSELPHKLGFVGSVYTDSRFWKDDIQEDGRFKPADQYSFHLYNARDCLVTLRSGRKLQSSREYVAQRQVYQQELALVPIAMAMQHRGMLIDKAAVVAVRDRLAQQEAVCIAHMKELLATTDYEQRGVGLVADFKPSGRDSIRAALMAIGIPITERTPTGLLATGQDVLATIMPLATDAGRQFIGWLIKNRKGNDVDPSVLGWRPASKLRTTYLENLPILNDGRLHADWLIHGTVSGRFASARPNMQNWAPWIRRVAVAPSGYKFVSVDYSQLEIRIQAWLSGDKELLKSFDYEDSHKGRAALIFNVPYAEVTKQQRQLGKRFIYAMAYGAQWETVYERLLPEYPGLDKESVKATFDKLKRAFPTWWGWRQAHLRETKERGYAESAILGRRRYFLGGMKPTDILNCPVQFTAADIINEATLKLWEIMKRDWPDVYLVNQMHDSLCCEVLEARVEAFAALLREVMPGPFVLRGVGRVVAPVDIKIGRTWADV